MKNFILDFEIILLLQIRLDFRISDLSIEFKMFIQNEVSASESLPPLINKIDRSGSTPILFRRSFDKPFKRSFDKPF